MKNYILTDFNSESWKGIDLKSVKSAIKAFNKKEIVIGQIGHPDFFDELVITNRTHIISNLSLDKENILHGDIQFLSTEQGKLAYDLIENCGAQFVIQSIGTSKDGITKIDKIISFNIIVPDVEF